MGFPSAYGGSRTTDSNGKRYNNSMVAHVWANQSERYGRSNNGNFYFEGPALYSYGSHFLVGYIMPDGTALLNASGYSISTQRHKREASYALSYRGLRISNLTVLRTLLDDITGKRVRKDYARRIIRENAASLQGEAGEYLTRAAGLPARTWPKLEREAAKLAERAKAAEAKAAAVREAREIVYFADMTATDFADQLTAIVDSYNPEHHMGEIAKRLRRLKIAAKARGYSAKRLASLRTRESLVRASIATAGARKARRDARKALRANIATLRNEARQFTSATMVASAARALSGDDIFPLATRQRLGAVADSADAAIVLLREEERQRQIERDRAKREAWLNGEGSGYVRFDSVHGGAALRIKGDELETSHGASVPLAHAIKAFRFVKLCRENGRTWQRNGQQIRVGHFQIDSIDASGDFVAGCHRISWPEVERAAIAAGVFDCPADDAAVNVSVSA